MPVFRVEQNTLRVNEALRIGSEELRKAGVDAPRTDARILLCHVLRRDAAHLLREPERRLTAEEDRVYRELIRRRAERVPVHYLTGVKEFYSRPFMVNRSVLIPRPETELLVERVIKACRCRRTALIVDLGTGSGVIGITLALETGAFVWATDVSPQALEVARCNAVLHGVQDRVTFLCGDFLAPIWDAGLWGRVEALVSNPPYVPTADIDLLMPEVARHEPRQALDGGADGLLFYRRLGEAVADGILTDGGMVAVEIGMGQADAVAQVFMRAGLTDLNVFRDYSGCDRVITGIWRGG